MTYTLFLDDERDPTDPDAIVCRSYEEAVLCVIFMGMPDHVDFDHDLGYGKNGYDFARWLIDNSLDGNGFPMSYEVHSQNPVGAENIRNVMDSYYRYMEAQA